MLPIDFEERNKMLLRPNNMPECGPLPVYTDQEQCVSKWKLNIKERFHCLFRGFIWVRLFTGHTQPPIALDAIKTIFDKQKEESK